MDADRRDPATARAAALKTAGVQASDALPIPIRYTNRGFLLAFALSLAYLLPRWGEKVRSSTPLRVVDFAELVAIVFCVASLTYLLNFFGIAVVQTVLLPPSDEEDDSLLLSPKPRPAGTHFPLLEDPSPKIPPTVAPNAEDEAIISSVVAGMTPSYVLESKLGDCYRAAAIRREALKRTTRRSLEGLPLDGFDYNSILGQCCELPVGYVTLPVGIAGPLALDGRQYYVPMATTEGCLVASTNRGCKAIAQSGGVTSVVLRDGMTRAPVVRLPTAARAAELKFFLEDPANFETLGVVFNRYHLYLFVEMRHSD